MSTWKRLAVRLFPEHSSGLDAFQKPHMSIYQVFFALKDDVDEHIQLNNQEGLKRVFEFTEWCFEQKNHSQDIWNAAATAFLEHLADNDKRAEIIPTWVKPDIFLAMKSEFKKRRERDGAGKFQILLENYNQANLTNIQD
jgi:hypothetical protein